MGDEMCHMGGLAGSPNQWVRIDGGQAWSMHDIWYGGQSRLPNMEAHMKENQHVKPVIDVEAGQVHFEVKGMATLTLNMTALHADVVKRAAMVGMAQVRIVDAAAIPAADDDGNIIPEAVRLAMKHEKMAALIAHYESGTAEWSRVSAGGGGGKSITIEAISAIQGKPYDDVKADVAAFAEKKYGGDTKKALAFLRTGSRVAEKIEEIRKSRLPAPKVDADEALAELGK